MTLTDVAKTLKRWWPFLILVLLAVFLAGFVILRPKPGEKAPVPPLPISTYSTSTQPVIFDFSKLEKIFIPENLGSYKAEVKIFGKEQALDLATKLGFEKNPTQILAKTTTGTLYSWVASDKTLTVSEQAIRFDVTLPQSGDPTVKLDLQTIEVAVVNFLNEIGFGVQTSQINRQLTKYFAIRGASIFSSDQNLADIVQFAFQSTIGGLPLVGQDPELGQITIQVDKKSNVVFFSINQIPGLAKISQYKIKSLETATKELGQKLGVIVKAVAKTKEGLVDVKEQPGFEIGKATFNKVFLAYYYPTPAPEMVFPIFVFEGDFVDKKGEAGFLTLYLPALEGQALSGK